jgi:uncharacterized protein (TIGR03067 family)
MAESDRLEGNWELIRAEMQGETAPEMVTQKTEMELTATGYAIRFEGETMDRGFYRADSGPQGKTLLLRGVAGTNAGRTIPCLYQLVGNRLRICFGLDGAAPAEFSARAGEERYLATYRRRIQ